MSNPNGDSHAATRTGQTQDPNSTADPQVPLRNLSLVRTRMDSLQRFLSQSINTNAPPTADQIAMVSNQIVSAIHHIIVNGAALVSYSQNLTATAGASASVFPVAGKLPDPPDAAAPTPKKPRLEFSGAEKFKQPLELKIEVPEDDDVDDCDDDCEIVELDAMELLAEHIHFCEICGKGFRRDANLRMHMRAHGNQFKTPEALAKPSEEGAAATRHRATRFSCPFEGCNRNKLHKKFRPLKSIVCVKNHFKRSHCPKMYSCNRCHKKNFSVLSDLKSHMKNCGESKWKCSCGTTFSRKDKLFGHIALFEGHMPALAVDEEEKGKQVAATTTVEMEEDDEDPMLMNESELGNYFIDDVLPEGFFDDLDGFSSLGFPVI